jgi:hypothetical protein
MCMYACMHVCMYACMRVCVIHVYVCMYACMHVCRYACMCNTSSAAISTCLHIWRVFGGYLAGILPRALAAVAIRDSSDFNLYFWYNFVYIYVVYNTRIGGAYDVQVPELSLFLLLIWSAFLVSVVSMQVALCAPVYVCMCKYVYMCVCKYVCVYL